MIVNLYTFMTYTIWIVIISLLIIISIVGSVMPFIPGPPIAFAALLIYKLCPIGNNLSWWWIVFGAILTLLAIITEYLIPIVSTKKFGGSKYGAIGATLGIILGFFIPFGFILGPFLGALLGELINDAVNYKKAFKASLGAFIGFFLGIGTNILVCGILITIIFIHYIFY